MQVPGQNKIKILFLVCYTRSLPKIRIIFSTVSPPEPVIKG